MPPNIGECRRFGAINKKPQVLNPITNQWIKLDESTGKIRANKKPRRKKSHFSIINS
jgi:hypothetical protein